MKKITWGIVGAGNIAASFAASLSQSEFSDCGAVASRDSERGGAFARKWGFRRTYMSYDELFADPDIDAVYIATPHMNHAALSVAALRAGKAVLCEKPAAVNARELQNIHECARTTGGFFMEALWTKFNPVFRKALEWIASGRIGTVQSISADFCISRPDESEEVAAGRVSNRLYDIKLADGALLDVGIYPVTAALAVVEAAAGTGALEQELYPVKVSAVARKAETGVDVFDSISLQFSHIIAHLSCAIDTECGNMLKNARITGSAGSVVLPLFWMAQKAELYNADGVLTETFEKPFAVNGYEYEIEEFCRCLNLRKNGTDIIESPLHTHHQSLRVVKVLDAVRAEIQLVYPFEKNGHRIMEETRVLQKTPVSDKLDFASEEITVYTDGGCSGNPGPGGWGCVIIADGVQYTTSGGEPNTTNNRMELSAAIAALSAIEQNSVWKNRPVQVFIDSQYVKNGISSWIKAWQKNGWKNSEKQPVKNRDLWEILDVLNNKLNVSWNWVKGHAGIEYNELCDQLASREVQKYSR